MKRKAGFVKRALPVIADGQDLIYGTQAVLEAVKAGKARRIFLRERIQPGDSVRNIEKISREAGLPVVFLPAKEFEKLLGVVGESSAGVAAQVDSFVYTEFADILTDISNHNKSGIMLVLDHLEDPHNLGAIIRTAEAGGVLGVIIPRDRAVGVTPAVRKVAAGAAEWVKIAQVTNLARSIQEMKKCGFWVFGAEADGDMPYDRADWHGRIALALGAEGKGLSRIIKKQCDLIVTIPLSGRTNSLNVSVAAGILLFQYFKQSKS